MTRRHRLFRALLWLFPADFRGDFGYDMALDHRDAYRDARRRGVLAVARFWVRTVPGLVAAGARSWRDDLLQDLRYAARTLWRSPGFSAAAIVMLAVGTGANTAMFSVIDAVLLRSPFADPGRVVQVSESIAGRPPTYAVPLSHVQTLAAAPQFAGVAAIDGTNAVLTGPGEPHWLDTECVSASLFPLLGVRAYLGRVLTPDDDRPGAEPVVVLAYRTWRRDFGGATDIVGRVVSLNGKPNIVVGVMPEGFLGATTRNAAAVWAPLAPAVVEQSGVGCRIRNGKTEVIARVRAPLTIERAAADINASALAASLTETDRHAVRIFLARADDAAYGGIRTPFAALFGAVLCVLLIACANVASLQLERLACRRREIAVRLALGASRSRIVRHTLAENLLLSAIGAAGGLAVAHLTLDGLVAMIPLRVPHVAEIAIDGRTLAITIAMAFAVGVAVGVLPAIQATRPALAGDLRQSSRSVTGGSQWLRRGLVVAEVTLSVVLLIGAALMIRTFLILRPVAPGFDPANRLIAQILFRGDWGIALDRVRFLDEALARVGALPGVASASGSSYVPMYGVTTLTAVRANDATADVWTGWITPGYSREMNIGLERGRLFTPADAFGAAPVALVNEALAGRFWPGADPIGRSIEVRAPDGSRTSREIVGVLRDTRSWGTDLEHRSELYIPYAQQPGSTLLYMVIRTAGPPDPHLDSQVRGIVAAVRPGQLVYSIEPFQNRLDRSVAQPRFGAWLFGVFAAIAVGLAALGLAAVIAWWVTERSREIGIRVALGAEHRQVVGAIVKQGLALAAVGTSAGLALAGLATRLITDWLYGVTALDPATFAGCGALVLTISGLAAYWPARKAARIDPIVALRAE